MSGYNHACTIFVLYLPVVHLPIALADHVRGNLGSVVCKPMWQNLRAYQTIVNIKITTIEYVTRHPCRYNSQTKCFRAHANMVFFSCFFYVEILAKICSHLSVTLGVRNVKKIKFKSDLGFAITDQITCSASWLM
jgi:hypothetical protein